MKKILTLFLLLFLAACADIEATQTPIVITTKVIPTSTVLPATPFPSITPTAETPCEPFGVDYCVTEGHFIFQRPIRPPGNDLVDPTYRYGSTADGTREPHHGVEFPNQSGTPVNAAAEGIVIFAGPDQQAIYAPWANFYGNLVVLEHADQLFTLYAHLSKITVKVGQKVASGDKIGEVGRTGAAIGSHLHFEVRREDVQDYFATQNPELWLMPPKNGNGERLGTLMISVVDEEHNLIKYAEFTLRSLPTEAQEEVNSYYGMTYSADMLSGDENAVLGELPAGQYRIAIERNGKVYERRLEVESGKLTQVAFVVK